MNYEHPPEIRFVDRSNQQVFTLPDGANIILTDLDSTQHILPCQYIDPYHTKIGDTVYHILEFALLQRERGGIYAPEHPSSTDICGSYEVYQLTDPKATEYYLRPYEEAKAKLHPSDYEKVYASVYGPGVTLRDLYIHHATEMRPFSVSDVIVTEREGRRHAFYVNRTDTLCLDTFVEAKPFLRRKARAKKKEPRNER